jgi:hypothetical protein
MVDRLGQLLDQVVGAGRPAAPVQRTPAAID